MKHLQMLAAVILLMVSFTFAQSDWKIDPTHSNIQFTVSHLVVSEVSGFFKKFDASAKTKDDNFKDAQIEFTADVNSISTDNEKRDAHLRSDDFFNAEKFPQIKFKSKSFKKISNNKYKLTGDFTIRDVTKTIDLDVTFNGTIKDPWGNTRAGFKIAGSINRFDYNLKWNNLLEAGGAVVGKTVELKCNVELIKSK
jgi:Uncharacterized conserved protein